MICLKWQKIVAVYVAANAVLDSEFAMCRDMMNQAIGLAIWNSEVLNQIDNVAAI